jgi:hypothetical protein
MGMSKMAYGRIRVSERMFGGSIGEGGSGGEKRRW